MNSVFSVDPDKWVVIERAIAETIEALSRRLKSLEDEKGNKSELVKQQVKAIPARKGHRKQTILKPTKDQAKLLDRLEADGIALKRKPRSLRPSWWSKVEQLIVALRRSLNEDAAGKIENEINYEVGDFYSRVTPKADDELAHYRERMAAEEEAARWLRNYLTKPWLLNYMRGKLSKQQAETPPAVPAIEPQPASRETACKGVAPRDAWFLRQYKAIGTDTYHKPKVIQEKWWYMTENQRAEICPNATAKISHAAVAKAIKRAQTRGDGRPAKRKPKRCVHTQKA
jgi:hypothetical protein